MKGQKREYGSMSKTSSKHDSNISLSQQRLDESELAMYILSPNFNIAAGCCINMYSMSKLLLSLSYVPFCHLIHIWVTPNAAKLESCTVEDCRHLREPVVIFCHFTLNAVVWDHGCSQVKLMPGSSRSNMIFLHHRTDVFCLNSTQWLLLFRDSFWILNFKAQPSPTEAELLELNQRCFSVHLLFCALW